MHPIESFALLMGFTLFSIVYIKFVTSLTVTHPIPELDTQYGSPLSYKLDTPDMHKPLFRAGCDIKAELMEIERRHKLRQARIAAICGES